MNRRGFTLIEILLVVAAIAILAGLVIIAINPNKQLGDTNNARRWADVNTILNAVYQYSIDNAGELPSGITGSFQEICQTDASSCSGLLDLDDLTDQQEYMVKIPIDPKRDDNDNDSGYEIRKSSYDRIEVRAPLADGAEDVEVTR